MQILPTDLCTDCKRGALVPEHGDLYVCEHFDYVERLPSHCRYYEGERTPVDIIIITAVPVEFNTVLQFLHDDGVAAWEEWPTLTDGDWQICSMVCESDKNVKLNVALTQLSMMGLSAAAALTSLAIQVFRPTYVVMLGIAAGLSDKACIGDIIAPNFIWDYGAGRWSDDNGQSEFQPRVQPHDVDINIVRRYYKMSGDKVFLDTCHKTWLLIREDAEVYAPPKVEVAPMVSGAAVVSAQSVLKQIKGPNDKICGLDMEAFGVAHAVKCATGPLYTPQCLVIKSVCDFGVDKDKKGQRYAALTSTLFFKKYMNDYVFKADLTACPRRQNIPKFF